MKPNYNFFKNSSYAAAGLAEIFKNEKSFRIEICIILPLFVGQFFVDLPLFGHLFLIITLFGVLIAECVNSAIERAVDLACGGQSHPLAKAAKDAGSASVFIAITTAAITWALVLADFWGIFRF